MKHIVYLLLLLPALCMAEPIKPFTTDGCSSFPDGTVDQQWLWFDCCLSHDMRYWKGGTEKQRQQADESLQQCVAELGEPVIAKLMYHGVRIGGTPHVSTPFRWGYGWPTDRGYKALTAQEKEQVFEQLQLFQLKLKTISNKVVQEMEGK